MKERLIVVAALGGLAAVIVLVVVVVGFGRHDPSPPSLVDDPNPAIPGRILYLDGQGCIIVAQASGASREDAYCPGTNVYQVTWLDGDTIMFGDTTQARPPVWVEVDLATQETTRTDREAIPPQPWPVLPDGTRAWTDGGTLYVTEDGQRREVAEFDVPEHRSPFVITWSPDGQWLLLEYYDDGEMELWIVSRDGEVRGTLVNDATGFGVGGVSWWIEDEGVTPPAGTRQAEPEGTSSGS